MANFPDGGTAVLKLGDTGGVNMDKTEYEHILTNEINPVAVRLGNI